MARKKDKTMKMKNKCLLAGALVGGTAICLTGRSAYECAHFVTETEQIVSPKIRQPKTLVFLTDLHDNRFGAENAQLLDALRAQRPDAVLIGGDMMVSKRGKADLRQTALLLEELRGMAPVYYAYGNHESRLSWEKKEYGAAAAELRRLLRQTGTIALQNRSAMLGEDIRISGLDLGRAHYRTRRFAGLTAEGIAGRIGPAGKDKFQILLAHTPVFAEGYRAWGADLMLCGHFHGGVIRIPGIGGVLTPQEHLFHPYGGGTYRTGDQVMIVGRGLGTHTLNIRLNNRPQLLVIHLLPSG